MQLEPLMLGRPKVTDQTKRDSRVLALVIEVHFRDASAHQMCLCNRTSDGVTTEEDPTYLKKAKLVLAQWERPDTGPVRATGIIQTRYRVPGTRGN